MNRILQMSKRERLLVWAALAAVIGGGLYLYAVEPFATQWTALRAEANRLAAEQAKLENLLANRAEIERGYNDIRGAVTAGVSEEDMILSFLRQIEDVARRSGLSVTTIKPLGLERERGFDRLTAQLGLQSEGHQFVGFLQALQRGDQFLRCENFTVSVGKRRPPLTISITLSKLMSNESGTL